MDEIDRRDRKVGLIRRISLIIGALFGILMVIYYSLGPFTGFEQVTNPATVPVIIIATIIVQIVSAIAVTYGFTILFIRLNVSIWLSLPAGALFGLVAGAISGGLTMGTLFGIAVPAGAISMSSFMELNSWWKAFGFAFFAGGVFGGMTGILPGAIFGPIISFTLKS